MGESWISFEDEEPSYGALVFVFVPVKGEGSRVALAYFYDDSPRSIVDFDTPDLDYPNATHWCYPSHPPVRHLRSTP